MKDEVKGVTLIVVLILVIISSTLTVLAIKYNFNVAVTPKGSNITRYIYLNTTGSMRPLIVEGVEVEAEVISIFKSLNVGDVAIYRDDERNKTILHRVVFKYWTDGEWHYVFKGDNNLYPDTKLIPHSWVQKKLISVRYTR